MRQIVAIRDGGGFDTWIGRDFVESVALGGRGGRCTIDALRAVDFGLEGASFSLCVRSPVWLGVEDSSGVFGPRHHLSLAIFASHARHHVLSAP